MHATPCVLLLVPAGSLGGIDLLSFTTTERFRGIRDLPAGWHFVFTSSTSSLSIRHGAWFRVRESASSPPDLFVMKWDPHREILVPQTHVHSAEAALGSGWQANMTPYRQTAGSRNNSSSGSNSMHPGSDDDDYESEREGDWHALTDAISERLLDRILGADDGWSLTSASSAARDMDDILGLPPPSDAAAAAAAVAHKDATAAMWQLEKELKLLPVELKVTWAKGATGRARTVAARDRSWALSELVKRNCDGRPAELLGELQFAFLMLLTLNNTSCLEQWKRLLELLLTCARAVVQRPAFYTAFLRLLRLQLWHCQDTDTMLFDLADEDDALLKRLLRRFRRGLEDLEGMEQLTDVVHELDELERFLSKEYGWQLDDSFVRRGMLELEDGEQVEMDVGTRFDEDDETGEFAPMVVDLTEEQVKGLVDEGVKQGNSSVEAAKRQDRKLSRPESWISSKDMDHAVMNND